MRRCGLCGRVHDDLPMAIAYRRPPEYFRFAGEERDRRVRCTDDLCSVDDREFLIRGVLSLPVRDAGEEFEWGLWASVAEGDFLRYVALWEAEGVEQEPPFAGRLSGGPKPYPDSDGLAVRVYLRSSGQRPRFEVVSPAHPLGIDQRRGITRATVHAFIELCMPGVVRPGA